MHQKTIDYAYEILLKSSRSTQSWSIEWIEWIVKVNEWMILNDCWGRFWRNISICSFFFGVELLPLKRVIHFECITLYITL